MNMETNMTTRTFKRHDMKSILPGLLQRVRAAEFGSLEDIAAAYGIDKATACRWKARAINAGTVDERTWRVSMLRARMLREMAA